MHKRAYLPNGFFTPMVGIWTSLIFISCLTLISSSWYINRFINLYIEGDFLRYAAENALIYVRFQTGDRLPFYKNIMNYPVYIQEITFADKQYFQATAFGRNGTKHTLFNEIK